MKKRVTAILLALCLILSAAPVRAGAAEGQRVVADSVTVTAGGAATVTIRAENFENIASLEAFVYYDPAVFTLASANTGSMLSGSQTSVNTNEAGTVRLATMSLDGISGNGTLLTLRFSTAADCVPGAYPITVAVGNAYDTELATAVIGSASGSVTVNEPASSTERFSLYGYPDRSTMQQGDVLAYRVANSYSRSFASGEFTFTYDHELFEFDSVELDSALTGEGALYSVNSSVLGQVRIAYVNSNPVSSYYLFTVKLKVSADIDATTTVQAQATNMYGADLSAYLPGECSSRLTLQKLPEVVDYPDAFLRTDMLVVGRQSKSSFCLEAGAGVAAADFTLTYDPAILRCVSVNAHQSLGEKGGMVVVNDNFSAGTIRFSYVNMDAYAEEELPIVEITWEPLQSPQVHYQVTISSVGVVDTQQNAILLEHVTDTGCIYNAEVTEPTCKTEGLITYQCACGQTAPSEILPVIPEEECTHYTVKFVNDGGTELSRQTCHYGDAVTAPENPTKAADEDYIYVFAGWDKEIVACTGNATYQAAYTAIYIGYEGAIIPQGPAIAGKTFKLAVSLADMPAYDEVDIAFTYDASQLELVAGEWLLSDGVWMVVELESGRAAWKGIAVEAVNGDVLTVEFQLSEDVTEGEQITVSCAVTARAAGDQVASLTASTAIEVSSYLPGDITGDGKVNNRDAVRLMQYLAGWDVEYVSAALDVNGDGKVNNRDAVRLMQYLAGWDVTIH